MWFAESEKSRGKPKTSKTLWAILNWGDQKVSSDTVIQGYNRFKKNIYVQKVSQRVQTYQV